MTDARHERVLIAPLHWGLGHAARCVPLIENQIHQGNEVIIAASGGPKALLLKRFPKARFIDIPFMTITYPADGNMVKHFAFKGVALLKSIWREHRLLQRIVKDERIDLVISDARFGLWTSRCRCVFVTHQIKIRSPHFEGLINVLNQWVMDRYDEVWIPDHAVAPGLAGELSHPSKMPKRVRYIGPLSRFTAPPAPATSPRWNTVVLISGPEPQRTLFEAEMARMLIERGGTALIVRGKPEKPQETIMEGLTLLHHLDDLPMSQALVSAELVIARSGYSTIMDLDALGVKNAHFYPTPGQTEQEYLALLHGGQSRVDSL
ncbi:MAG: glycosyltransferase [Cryomorphaceae bacterium]